MVIRCVPRRTPRPEQVVLVPSRCGPRDATDPAKLAAYRGRSRAHFGGRLARQSFLPLGNVNHAEVAIRSSSEQLGRISLFVISSCEMHARYMSNPLLNQRQRLSTAASKDEHPKVALTLIE